MNHLDHVRLLSGGLPPAPTDHPPVWADFGSGQGAFTLALAELLGPGAQIHSIDQDGRALRVQQQAFASSYPASCMTYHTADFSHRLDLPALDGLVMANALHFFAHPRQAEVVRLLKGYLGPHGRMLLVEYNVDRGNLWVPHPLSYPTWEGLARACGFTTTRLLATTPSSFLQEFYSALSIVDG